MKFFNVGSCLPVCVFLMVGCGDKEAEVSAGLSSPAAPASDSLNLLAAPAPAAAAPVASGSPAQPGMPDAATPINQPGEVGEDGADIGLKTLNEALQEFQENVGRMPDSLNELITKRYLRALPVPPTGKQYALEAGAGAVVLK